MKKNVLKEKEEEIKKEVVLAESAQPSELVRLLELWDELKALGVNSISDLEVKIARLQ
jgi:ribosomal protein L7Ae-like RNA K-turn-binding protein